jgi:hypothetical protein
MIYRIVVKIDHLYILIEMKIYLLALFKFIANYLFSFVLFYLVESCSNQGGQ